LFDFVNGVYDNDDKKVEEYYREGGPEEEIGTGKVVGVGCAGGIGYRKGNDGDKYTNTYFAEIFKRYIPYHQESYGYNAYEE
jgi:hypothetical protein